MWLMIAGTATGLILAIRLIYSWRSGKCHSKAKLNGKTVIITGASAGIGESTARDLAGRGARIIMACRNRTKAQKIADDIIRTTGNDQVVVRELDVSSLASVRKFAKEILDTEPALHILINNAGMGGVKTRQLTSDGLEITMATNHFGHFLLTNILLGLLKESAPSRIINVSSSAHLFTRSLNVDDLNYETETFPTSMGPYANSKLANILFTNEIANKLQGTGVTANSLHPGIVNTEILAKGEKKYFTYIFMLVFWLFGKDANLGAQTVIYLSVSDDVANVSGKYFVDCEITKTSELAQNQDLGKGLWEASEKLVHLAEAEKHYYKNYYLPTESYEEPKE